MSFFDKKELASTRKGATQLLSAGYREWLGRLVNEEIRQKFGLPEGSTWADAIAIQTIKRAVNLVGKDDICFAAITELRETTEGKTAERLVSAGNEELIALAKALQGPPAQDEGPPTIEGQPQ